MVSYNLNLQGHRLKLTPMRSPEIKLPDVDVNGIPSKRVYTASAQYHYENEKGEQIDKVYKLLNGKAVSKLKKTTETNQFKIVSKAQIDIIPELYYFVEADESFRKEIVEKDIAYEFFYSAGGGFHFYPKTYLTSYGQDLIMIAGMINISKQIGQIKAGKEVISQITDLKEEVPTAQAEELMALIE